MSNEVKAVFLDRDGVITAEKSYITKKEDLELINQVPEAIKIFNEKDYKVIVVTNQSAIARGLCTEEEIIEINNYLTQLLNKHGAKIDKFYYCPHHPEMRWDIPEFAKKYRIKCDCRKPLPGMILKAQKDFNINLKESWMVGDMITDIIAGKSAKCKTIMIESKNNNKIIRSHIEIDETVKADYKCKNLFDAVKVIINS
jgi:D-glycero-D-manno-heptose 1,7-bisphosphate phosphatase